VPVSYGVLQGEKITLPGNKQTFMSVWPIKGGIQIGIGDDMTGTTEVKNDVSYASMGAGPEVTYSLQAPNAELQIDVSKEEVSTRCITRRSSVS
jgi:hypothetical protein